MHKLTTISKNVRLMITNPYESQLKVNNFLLCFAQAKPSIVSNLKYMPAVV